MLENSEIKLLTLDEILEELSIRCPDCVFAGNLKSTKELDFKFMFRGRTSACLGYLELLKIEIFNDFQNNNKEEI